MSLAHNDLLPSSLAFHPQATDGEAACIQAFERLRILKPGFWLTLPVCGGAVQGFVPVLQAALLGPASAFPYAAIAAEAERPLDRGIRGASPLALLLIAALAFGRGGADDAARTLAQAALEMAARIGGRIHGDTRILHAALVMPFTASLEQAATELAALCEAETRLCCAHSYLAGTGFMAGLPLSKLLHQLERAQGLPAADAHAAAIAAELAVRTRLLRGLMDRQAAPASHTMADAAAPQGARFGFWTARLQAAVVDGDHAMARHAAGQAEALAGPLTPVGDRMAHHLFAALALSQANDGAAAAGLERHCAALRRLAQQLPASPVLQCAEAARARQGGDRLGALRGFDGAGAEASRQGRHALAALAWEQAAQEALACGLGAAVQHYRREALLHYEQWGQGEEARARNERMQHAGQVGELGLSIAHEVNQPLAAISLHAAAARKWLRRSQPDIERALSSLSLISAAGQHAGDIVRSVQRLASRKEQDMGSVPVDQTIADTLRLLHRPLRKHAIEVELALGLGDCAIHASRVQLQQVLTNLLVNATEALAGSKPGTAGRRIRVQSRRPGEHEIEIAVTDNGPGIAPEHAGRVFGNLFSTKPNSTGMGLSISLAIVRAHGGQIAYEPCEPHGACFRFRLPVQSSHP
jgi:signal transduction histidine kinase